MAKDNHDEWAVLQNEHKRLKKEQENDEIVADDAEGIKDFIKWDQRTNKLTTVRGHFTVLRTAARRSDVPLLESTEDDLSHLLSSMRSGTHPDVKDEGIGVSNYQKAFRVFYRFHDLGIEPDDIKIDKEQGRQLQPDDLLFQDDVDCILENCNGLRDRALVTLALATGQRVDAIRTLRRRHVTFEGQTMEIQLNEEEGTLKGASGSKPLLWAKEYVRMWYNNHPYSNDPDAALFCSMPDAPLPDNRDPRGPIHYQTVRDKIKRIENRSGIDKKLYAHLLRHTAITRMCLEGLQEQQIKKVVGWAKDSSRFNIYVHLADKLSNDSIRDQLGLPTSGDIPVLGRPTLKECPECHDRLPEDADVCRVCHVPLTTYQAVEGEYDEPRTTKPNMEDLVEDMNKAEMLEVVQSIEKKLSK